MRAVKAQTRLRLLAVKAQTRLRLLAVSSEPSLVAYDKSSISRTVLFEEFHNSFELTAFLNLCVFIRKSSEKSYLHI